jgi:hypothetical protein
MRLRRFLFGFAIYGMVELAASSEGAPLWYRIARGVALLGLLWWGAGGWEDTPNERPRTSH